MGKYSRFNKIVVNAPCQSRKIPEDSVEFIDIEEDFQGKDILTYKCPLCGEEHRSYRLGSNW